MSRSMAKNKANSDQGVKSQDQGLNTQLREAVCKSLDKAKD